MTENMIALNKNYEISSEVTIADGELYRRIVGCDEFAKLREFTFTKHYRDRYEGRTVRFCLWGAKGRYVQIGSKTEKAVLRRLRGKPYDITFRLPHITWKI